MVTLSNLKRLLLFFTFLFSFQINYSQEIRWAETSGTTGNDAFQHLTKGSDGSVYATGSENNQIILAKYSKAGIKLWDFSVGGTGSDIARAIAVDNDDNIYITGYFNGDMNFDPAGIAPVITSSNTDLFIAKYTSTGDYVWARSFVGSGIDNGLDVSISPDGHCYVTGSFSGTANFNIEGVDSTISSVGGKDVIVLKYDPTGNLKLVHKLIDTSGSEGRGITVDKLNNIYVSGNFLGTIHLSDTESLVNPESRDDLFVAKYDSDLNLQWYFRGSSTQTNQVRRMISDTSRQVIYLTGRYQTSSGTEKFSFLKNGGTIAEKQLSNDGNYDTFTTQISFNGILNWVGKGGGSATQIGDALSINSNGDVYQSGIYSGIGNSYFQDETGKNIEISASTEIGSYFAKYSYTGGLVAASKLTTASVNSEAYGIAVYDDGYGVIAGFYAGTASFPPLVDQPISTSNGNDLYIAKFRECTTLPLSVTVSANVAESCQADTIKFKSVLVNEGTSPGLQWLIDGSPIPGETKDSLSLVGYDAGSYTISLEVVSSETCGETKTSEEISILINASPKITIEPVAPLCYFSQPFDLTASTVGGVWSGPGITDPQIGTFDPQQANMGDNIISYIIEEQTGCNSVGSITIEVLAPPATPILESSTNRLCVGETLIFTTPLVEGASYSWSGPNGFSSMIQNPTLTNVTGLASGTYKLFITQDGCQSDTAIAEIIVNELPTVSITASDANICNGESVTFNALTENSGDNITYLWKVNGENAGTDSEVFTSSTLTELSRVSVLVSVYDICAGDKEILSNEVEINVAENILPTIEISAPQTEVSSGEEVTFTSVITGGGDSPAYKWYINNIEQVGSTGSTFTTTYFEDGQVVKAELISSENCITTNNIFSNEVTVSVIEVTAVNNYELTKSIRIYPVPLKDRSLVEFKNFKGNSVLLKLYNLKGDLLRVISSDSMKFYIERGNLPSGIYNYVIIVDGKYTSGKLLVE